MKKIIKIMLLIVILIVPYKIYAEGSISVSPSSLTIEQGSSKTIAISAYNTIGDVSISTGNSSIASISTSSWSTGMVEEKTTKSGSVTITGNAVGSTSILFVIDAATFDEEPLTGQTRTVTVNVVETPAVTPSTNDNSNNNSSNTNNNRTQSNNSSSSTSLPATSSSSNNNSSTSKSNTTTNQNTETNTKKSSNNYLKEIKLSTGSIEFNKDTLEYSINVDSTITEITVDTSKEDDKATVVVDGNKDLKNGENKITVTVTAEDGSQKVYTIIVNKKSSNDASIKKIKITNYKLAFKANKIDYDLLISNENYLTIDVELNDEKATYEIVGNKNLENGSEIKIIVTAVSGDKKTYNIHIKKNTNKKPIALIILLSISIAINIGFVGELVYRIVKNKKINKLDQSENIQTENIQTESHL